MDYFFTRKLKFDGENCRTQGINSAVAPILSMGGVFRNNKDGQQIKNEVLSALVEESQQYSNLYGELIDNLDINSIEKNLTSKNANEYLEENK